MNEWEVCKRLDNQIIKLVVPWWQLVYTFILRRKFCLVCGTRCGHSIDTQCIRNLVAINNRKKWSTENRRLSSVSIILIVWNFITPYVMCVHQNVTRLRMGVSFFPFSHKIHKKDNSHERSIRQRPTTFHRLSLYVKNSVTLLRRW